MTLANAAAAFLAALAVAGAPACASSTANNGSDKKKDDSSKPAKVAAAPTVAPVQGDFDPKTVVATMGDTKLTLAELDKTASSQIDAMRREHLRKLGELRERALDNWINEKLLEQEAKKQGLKGTEALLDKEVEKKLKPVTDDAAKKFFAENSDRMGGMTFDIVKDRIKGFLQNQARAELYTAYIEGLRKKAGVKVSLPVMRTAVDTVGPTKGPANAPITIVEFSDYECPYCGKAQDAINKVFAAYKGKVRLVFKDFPLDFHENAPKASEAAHCADSQGKYWEYHDKLFANQTALTKDSLVTYAKEIKGLDYDKWLKCLDSGEMAKKVAKGLEDGKKAGVDGTPAFFVNGIMLGGARPFEDFKKIIDAELARAASDKK